MILRRFSKIAVVVSSVALCTLGIHAVALSDAGIPKHVLTWAYDGEYGGLTDGAKATSTNPVSQRHVQTWVSFAEAGIQRNGKPQKAYYDCYSGSPCKNVVYFDPNIVYSTCWPAMDFISQNTSEDFYLHDSWPPSQSNRTMGAKKACRELATVYYPNGLNPAVGQWFARNLLWLIPKNTNTVMFQDDSTPTCKYHFAYGAKKKPAELQGRNRCDESQVLALRTIANQMQWQDGTPVPVIANAFGPHYDPVNEFAADLVAPGSHIIGGVEEEGEIAGTKYTPRVVFGNVNTASLVYAANPDALYGFLESSRATPGSTDSCVDSARNIEDSCGALQLRRDMLASFWLGYSEGHTILWENFNSSGNKCCGGKQSLAVYPEASLYLSSPIQALRPFDMNTATTNGSGCGPRPGSGGIQSFVVACGTLNDGSTPAGVYVREFRQCYNFGQLIGTGQCAVIMNTTNRAVTAGNWFTKGYTRSMTFGSGPTDGGDVLTAGCGDGQCPKSAMNPLGASFTVGGSTVPAFDAVFLFHD